MAFQFLTITDFDGQIEQAILAQITGDTLPATPTNTESMEKKALAEMQSYLRPRFEISNEFAKSGADRNQLLVLYLVDMVIYHVYSSVNMEQLPIDRVDRYNAAKAWLKMVADGKIDPGLTFKVDLGDTTKEPTVFLMGSNTQDTHHW